MRKLKIEEVMHNPVNWFEIPVHDMDRAQSFYEIIFDIKIAINPLENSVMGWFPFDHAAPGATGTLIKGESYIPSHAGTMVYFSVTEINDVLTRVEQAGGKILNTKFSIGEHGFCGHFEDTEGNRIALHQGIASS
ncbi:MAG: VOC family protein [Cytophagales bacterium]|nr:VOC family protein [Cytophagales bacterium]